MKMVHISKDSPIHYSFSCSQCGRSVESAETIACPFCGKKQSLEQLENMLDECFEIAGKETIDNFLFQELKNCKKKEVKS